MTIGFICILIASFLPVVWIAYAKITIPGGFKPKYNRNSREILEATKGKTKRAKWAHDNSWEAFAPFAAAVIIAHYLKVDQSMIDYSAIVFIIARLIYGLCYIYDKSLMRSIVWFVGLLAVVNLYYQAW